MTPPDLDAMKAQVPEVAELLRTIATPTRLLLLCQIAQGEPSVADLERELPYYAERHMVKPGITGWAQINYPYGASTEDARHKLEYDLYYAKNYTPFLDLLILLQTLRVVLWPEGAR